MAEILTESFCERCGTRYTFEAATPKKHRIGRLKVLSKGLKNYVLSDDASLDEALADARSEEERELSGGQLDAFHQTFQFCMSCRQYTCSNCWNEAEGRCLSCAPLSLTGNAQLGSPLDDLLARGGMAPLASPAAVEGDLALGTNGTTNGQHSADEAAPADGSAWPTIDLFRTAESAPPADAATTIVPEAVAPAVPEVETPFVPEAVAQVVPEAEAEAEAAPEAEAADAPAAPRDADLSEPSDFWTKPFTGFAPIAEPTNGHSPSTLPTPSPEEAPPVEAAAEIEPAARVDAAIAATANAPEPAAEVELTKDPLAAVEIEAESFQPVEAAVAVEADEAVAAPVELAAVAEPLESVEPIVESVEPVVEAVEPIVAQALSVDPVAEARAMELAERTTRLLGRLRVQPRSAGSAPAPAPADDRQAPAAQAPALPQAPAPSPTPAAAQAPAPSRAPAASWPRLQPQPARTPVQPVPPPKPVDDPALIPFDKLVERPAPPAWMQPAAAAAPVEPAPQPAEPAPEPVEAAPPQPLPEPIAELLPEASAADVPPAEPAAEPPAAEPLPAAAATDRVEMPAWPRLTRPPLSDSPAVQAPPLPMPAQAPQWPAPLQPGYDASSTPFWASGDSGRVAGEIDVWTASAREVAEAPGQVAGVQSCIKCGLSISATARFCRRCGSRQG
jgi:ribosomal protein L40E